MQTNHSTHGRGTLEDGPDEPDCPCRTTPMVKICADEGCGFCKAALDEQLKSILTHRPFLKALL